MTASTPSASPLHRRSAALSLSNPLAAAMAARNVYYGWVVAAATFLVMLATAGAMGAPGVIIRPLEKEFGWSAADISSALALRIALFGLDGAVFGRLHQPLRRAAGRHWRRWR